VNEQKRSCNSVSIKFELLLLVYDSSCIWLKIRYRIYCL